MTTTHTQLSSEPYRGTRDFYPEEMSVQNYIFTIMKRVVERYGYTEYGASLLEDTAIYRAKTGSEIVNEQTYSFIDRGGREVTIRPEMTPTVARMVARRRQTLAFPLRWYSIPNLFRYERPQRGRLREHWQLNVDVFGIDSIAADAEIIAVAHSIMTAFGAQPDNFVIRVNNRKLMNHIMNDYLKLTEADGYQLSKLIDRKNKLEAAEFETQARALLGDRTTLLLEFLACDNLAMLPSVLKNHVGVKELQDLVSTLQTHSITNVIFDPALMRGFDYYTGTVFEVFDTSPANNRSLFGGGRYDDLVGIFNVEKVSGVGFGMGDVTIRDYLETYNLLPIYQSTTQVMICPLNNTLVTAADELATYLRRQEINVAVDYTGRKVGAQIKTAEKQGVAMIICIGEDEVVSKQYKLKHLSSRQEQTVSWEELPAAIKS